MGELCHIYVFGDETLDYREELSSLVHHNDDPLLVSFFERTYHALRAEIGCLPRRQLQHLLSFANFAELVAQSVAVSVHPGLDQALACAYQLARFLRLALAMNIEYDAIKYFANQTKCVWTRMAVSKSRQHSCHWVVLRRSGGSRCMLLYHVLEFHSCCGAKHCHRVQNRPTFCRSVPRNKSFARLSWRLGDAGTKVDGGGST